MVPAYQFIGQAREPIVLKQPEQEMLANIVTVTGSYVVTVTVHLTVEQNPLLMAILVRAKPS
jgi:hypothetical protein